MFPDSYTLYHDLNKILYLFLHNCYFFLSLLLKFSIFLNLIYYDASRLAFCKEQLYLYDSIFDDDMFIALS